LHAALTGALGLGDIEYVASHGIGKLSQGPAIINLGLGPFGFQLVENSHQLGDLLLVEIELVRQEAQRPPDAEARPAFEPIRVVMSHEAPCSLTTMVMSVSLTMLVVFRLIGIKSGMK
jgi:hypothetical protein